jgi:type IV secretory pathway TrbL component
MFLRRLLTEKFNVLPPLTMVVTGLVLIAIGLIWPRMTLLHGGMTSGGVDFIQGFAIGIGVACELMGIGSMFAGRRGKRDDSSSVPPR